MVIADITARRQVGIQRYGTALQAHNGRDMLRDAYEEALDLAIYLRGVLEEREPQGELTEDRQSLGEALAAELEAAADQTVWSVLAVSNPERTFTREDIAHSLRARAERRRNGEPEPIGIPRPVEGAGEETDHE